MQGKIKAVFMHLGHDRLMVTTQKKIILGKSILQGIWTETTAQTYPDRRLSVCDQGCVMSDVKQTARDPGSRASESDGLLGSLLLQCFAGAAFTPLLPSWAANIDWFDAAEAADTVWMDRRQNMQSGVHAHAGLRTPAPVFV